MPVLVCGGAVEDRGAVGKGSALFVLLTEFGAGKPAKREEQRSESGAGLAWSEPRIGW